MNQVKTKFRCNSVKAFQYGSKINLKPVYWPNEYSEYYVTFSPVDND